MNHDDQAVLPAPYAGGATNRLLPALAFLVGGFAAELTRPVNYNLIHRPPARQPVRRPQEPS